MQSTTTKKSAFQIELVSTSSLKPYENNARVHSDKQVNQIAASIKKFGFINPVIIDDNKSIIAGHGRYEAAKLLKLSTIPVIRASHLSEAEIKAYRIADNKIALNSSWDNDLLKIELEELSLNLDIDFDLSITGFETAEIDILIDGDDIQKDDPDDVVPEIDDKPAVTKTGDVWQLGNHRVICGNSLEEETYQKLMVEEKARLILTDSPFNVPVNGHVCGNGKVKHREFAMASGEMSDQEFEKFLETYMQNVKKFSVDGSIHYHFMDWRGIGILLSAGKRVYTELKNICVWSKNNGGMGSLYRSQHELVVVYKNGTKAHINNIELGKYGRYRTNIWNYAGVNSFGKHQKDLSLHPTVKPVAMLADAIKDCSNRGDIVLDPFGGSGSTLIAAEKTGRTARLIEIDAKYCDVIIKRWQSKTKQKAVHIASGKTFEEISNNNSN